MPQITTGSVKITTLMSSRAFRDGWEDVMKVRGWRDDYDTDPRKQGRYERGRLLAVYVLAKHGEGVRGKTYKIGNRVPQAAVDLYKSAAREGVML